MISRAINELTFIILPFIAVIMIGLADADGSVKDLFYISDPAIASCIMWGQLAARFEFLKGYEGENADNFVLFTNMLRLAASIALILYVLLLTEELSLWWHLSKNVFFLATLFCYGFFSHISFKIQAEVHSS
ncbi:hypothetical protein BCT30_08010 [Enterovibrio norvegicus]|uniref:hypothetical protein n=1 Tax=Enterovibrio norvegicus TaxID=188144 RepID=UPI000C842116|nr:hypothetical protein [Enterovibrio norvegicus]MCC4796968.1 hypothetical protein [Enterovibrio norvegicus]PMI34349.1 hypothetical protein BCU47_06640 [Enterovibrio norvegicus]PMI40706.1 hypothetical protein BCU46_04715 [Enterovibrio norvegicus]PMN56388.1 hypothetical protein BCT30_08010 [Enterovibrio norvegicus]TKF09322.1 hypothetical protein FCV66_21745 [Enterovibrio norvegicus]